MTAAPLVTAILPSWNAEAFIRDTLACLNAQTWPALEIVAGDDASADGTPEILKEWAAARPEVTLVLRERNLGWVENCNDLMARARGEYLFFAFHDDQIDPTYVEELVGALERDPKASLAYAVMRRVNPDGSRELRDGRGTGLQRTAFRRAAAMITGPGHWGVPNRGLFRAAAYRRIGGMKRHEAGEFSADFPWLLHMMLIGRFVLVPKPLCTKVLRPEGLSQTWSRSPQTVAARNRSAAREVAASDRPPWEKLALRLLLRHWPALAQMRRQSLNAKRRKGHRASLR